MKAKGGRREGGEVERRGAEEGGAGERREEGEEGGERREEGGGRRKEEGGRSEERGGRSEEGGGTYFTRDTVVEGSMLGAYLVQGSQDRNEGMIAVVLGVP
jgi:hypothetical protein